MGGEGMKIVSWFSAGVSSAVATKLLADEIAEIFYIHIDDQHPDTLRFVDDCAEWFGKSIRTMRSRMYNTVEQALQAAGRMRRPNHSAPCTEYLKKRVRKEWEWFQEEDLCYVWGMDLSERNRADGIVRAMPKQTHRFPLIEKGLTKQQAHAFLREAGIRRPAMYDLGYHNNNCIGCVRGGMGYWNKIRVDFPEVFAARAVLEREIDSSCIKGCYLDELESNRGLEQGPLVGPCGIMCQLALDEMT